MITSLGKHFDVAKIVLFAQSAIFYPAKTIPHPYLLLYQREFSRLILKICKI